MTAEQVRMADPVWTLGERLEKARKAAGYSRPELAIRLGISRNTVINYETDRTIPTAVRRRLWAEVTGVREAWLLPRLDSNQEPAGYRLRAAA